MREFINVFGTYRNYQYSKEDKISSRRHALYKDRTGEHIIKFLPKATPEMRRKISLLQKFRQNFEADTENASLYLTRAFPLESVYFDAARSPQYWAGYVMRCCCDKSLYEVGMRPKGFKDAFGDSWLTFLAVCASLCYGARLLRRKNILLSDIKPDNFLVTQKGLVYPIDTDGFSYFQSVSQPPLRYYLPEGEPLPKNGERYVQSEKNECYALSVLLFQMFTGWDFLGGKNGLKDLRKYDLIGEGEYAEFCRSRSVRAEYPPQNVKWMFYRRWYALPNHFRGIFLNLIYNHFYRLPTADGWYRMITEYRSRLQALGEDYPLIPARYDSCDSDLGKPSSDYILTVF